MAKIDIEPNFGKILITAGSGYGKTFLSSILIKMAIAKGWKVNALLYTPNEVDKYFKDVKDKMNIVIAEETNFQNLINFIVDSIKNNLEGSVIYVNDLDLYIENEKEIELLVKLFSAIRKLNTIFIYELKVPKNNFVSLVELTNIIFLGKFRRYSATFDNWGYGNLYDEMMNLNANEHVFLLLKDQDIYKVKADSNQNKIILYDDIEY